MDVGMLWFDNDKERDLNAKVKRAVEYYQKKYGNVPNLCYVHPNMLTTPIGNDQKKVIAGGVEIRSNLTVLPNHLWLGVNRPN